MTEKTSREDKAIIALHDHATRHGATKTSVLRGMRADGFSSEEISKAAESYGSGNK